jgi:preprotein translocase subunit SecE
MSRYLVVTKTEETSSAIDTFKLMTAVLVLIAGVVAFYYFEDESQLLRVLGMLGVAVVAFLIAATTDKGRRGLAFVKDARIEVRKVVWPTRQEAMQTTVAVLFMVVLVAIMLWLFDMFLGWGISKLLA